MGFGDRLRDGISKAIGATPVTKALDPSMNDHADALHPVPQRKKDPGDFPPRPKYNPNKGEVNY